jgi:hypothetical protein
VIRFSASLVVVALGLLVAGGVTSKLLLVYVAIAVSAIALVFLLIGAILGRGELRASSPAETPGGRLDEASAGRLDRAPADDREEAAPGRPDSVAAGVPGDDLPRWPDRLVAGGRGDDAGMHGEAPMARPDAATTAITATTASTADPLDTKDPADPLDTKDPADPLDTNDPAGTGDTGDTGDHTGPSDSSGPGCTENVKDAGGTGGIKDAGDTRPAGQVVTVVPGVPRYHRSDCILIRFMGDSDLQKMPAWAARKAGCTPCRACYPDGEEKD